MITTFKILLNQISEIKEFVETTSRMANVIDVESGRYKVNGKSLMGLFAMDLSMPLKITIYGEVDPCFETALRKFEVK